MMSTRGKGKTRTISELVRALLRCTSKDIIVLSERNGAIDAIAEKFATLCVKHTNGSKRVADMEMWSGIQTFGSAEAIGQHTRLFLVEEKVKYVNLPLFTNLSPPCRLPYVAGPRLVSFPGTIRKSLKPYDMSMSSRLPTQSTGGRCLAYLQTKS
jgi:hypothetical protein